MTDSSTQRLDRWKVSLLDLTLRNRLLDVRDSKQAIALALPEARDMQALIAALDDGAAFRLEAFRAPALEEDRAADVVAKAAQDALEDRKLLTTLSAAELDKRLVTMARAAAANLADGGVHTLWLGLGLLEWTPDDHGAGGDARPRTATKAEPGEPAQVRTAPLVLWPVELSRAGAGERYRLSLSDEEPRHNATLFEKLRVDFGIKLPARAVAAAAAASGPSGGDTASAITGAAGAASAAAPGAAAAASAPAAPDDDDELDLPSLLDRLGQAVAHKPGWRVLPGARLGVFSFAKFVMWTDLSGRAERLLENPLVAHLAKGQGEAFSDGADFPDADKLDVEVPVGHLLTPLDADGSQLAAVKAAAMGKTFVLQGPPGTGKSQTITNLICHCLSEGKSVLFVSEKMAALEVVQKRLHNSGLGDFCLELHSHKAKRKEVIDQLGRVLDRSWRPGSPGGGDDAKLARLRATLDDYVAALHQPGPLGKSVHDTLARLVELRDVPRQPALAGTLAGLDAAGWARRRDAVAGLAQAATALGPLASHPWRGSRLREWQLSSADQVTEAIEAAAAAASALQAAVAQISTTVPGLRGATAKELRALAALCEVAATSPRPAADLVDAVASRRDEGAPAPAKSSATGEVAEKIAAVKARARGDAAGAAEPRALLPVRRPVPRPTDPAKYVELARRHRALASEVNAHFAPTIDKADVSALATTFRAWAGRFFLWRFFALRKPRAQVREFLLHQSLPDDAVVADELDKVAGERALRAALEAARPDAEKWFGARAPGALAALELDRVDVALAWSHQLAEAFASCAVAEGSTRSGVWRALLAQLAVTGDGAATLELAPFAAVATAAARWQETEAALAAATGLDCSPGGAAAAAHAAHAAHVSHVSADHLTALVARCRELSPAVSQLRDHVAFARATSEAEAAGASAVAAALEAGTLTPELALPAWERATLLAHCEERIAAAPALKEFHGSTHHANIVEFVELDRATLVLAKARAIAKLAERVPKVSADAGGEVGTLMHELKKQRRHKPLRDLFRLLPTLLPRLKPCLLMSPLSVAQYLDPSLPRFDLVVFDEASQIPTADAIGALARGERAIIVGDSRQLPPTRFFEVGGAGDEVDTSAASDDEEPYEELESVLDESVAARVPQMSLRWHYRSRHEDLIAFSNHRYYEDRLFVFPAAAGSAGELGVSLRKIDGVYDRAATRTNRAEAEAVVAEVLARLRDPVAQKRSLGVVTFSKAQQELVEDLLDDALRDEPALELFFSSAVPEPVLVKNLETVQGDERDVMLFCIGYGPDARGKVTMNFGPLGRDGGERRLNVAITRAREQLVVFTSLEPEQIGKDVAAAGVRHLGEFLAFAKKGGGAALPPADARPASAVSAAVAKDLEARGHTVAHLVGCAGYRIDLAVADPDDPRKFVLAIETDGAAYGAAPVARDRDRLRGQVLAQLGWRTHRIWALDFWADPDKELARAHSAVIAAIAAARQNKRPAGAGANAQVGAPVTKAGGSSAPVTAGLEPSGKTRGSGAVVVAAAGAASEAVSGAASAGSGGVSGGSGAVTRPVSASGDVRASGAVRARDASRPSAAVTAPVERPGERPGDRPGDRREPTGPVGKAESLGIVQYAVANVPAGRRAPDDLFAPKHEAEIGKVVEQVMAAEAPMRLELLVRRVAAYFGIARVTAKVVEQVRANLGDRVIWGDEPDVVWRADQDPKQPPPLRAQSSTPQSRRDIDDVPLVELAEVARRVVERAVGITRPELGRELARLLGYGRATERVVARIDEGIEWAKARGALLIEGERVQLP